MDYFPPTQSLQQQNSSPSWGIWLLVILGILILITIIIGVIFATRPSVPTTTSTSRGLTNVQPTQQISTINESSICSLEPTHRQWIVDSSGKGSCQCIYPFTGPTCDNELVDPAYQEVAAAGSENYAIQPLYTTSTAHLTYGEKPNCTDYCNTTDNCIGVVYNNNICTLVTGQVRYQAKAPKLHGPLYLKRNSPVVLENQLVIYTGQLPANYWTNPGNNYQVLEANRVYRLQFTPSQVLGNSNWTGLLSPNILPTDYTTLQAYLQNTPSTVTVISPGQTQVSIPGRWLNQQGQNVNNNGYYVVFLPK